MNEPRRQGLLLGDVGGELGGLFKLRPDVIYRVAPAEYGVELFVGIWEARTDRVDPAFSVVLSPTDAATLRAVLVYSSELKVRFGKSQGEAAYNVIYQTGPQGEGFGLMFGEVVAATGELGQIANVIMTDEECSILDGALEGGLSGLRGRT